MYFWDSKMLKKIIVMIALIVNVCKASSFEDMKSELVKFLLASEATDVSSNPIELKRIGKDYDGGYVVPLQALMISDSCFGYGIDDDISFEEEYSALTGKPSFGFDGGVQIEPKHPLCTFVNECLGTDKWLYGNQTSSGKTSTFTEQLNRFNLSDKRVFIKMDIENAEYDELPKILIHHEHVTGIVLEVHYLHYQNYLEKALILMRQLSDNFVLVHLHGNNYCNKNTDFLFDAPGVNGQLPSIMELTYIHKSLLSSSRLKDIQEYPTSIDMPNLKDYPEVAFQIMTK